MLHSTLGLILLLILVVALIGSLPHYGYSRGWGYYPFGGIGGIILILVILAVLGVI